MRYERAIYCPILIAFLHRRWLIDLFIYLKFPFFHISHLTYAFFLEARHRRSDVWLQVNVAVCSPISALNFFSFCFRVFSHFHSISFKLSDDFLLVLLPLVLHKVKPHNFLKSIAKQAMGIKKKSENWHEGSKLESLLFIVYGQ